MSARLDEDSELMIDALRGIAAILVLVTHCVDFSVASVFGWNLAANPDTWRWARASLGYGGFWVWCFFVISGLCIQQSIARSALSGTFHWRRYLTARVTRIYPLFLIGLVLAIVAWKLSEDWGDSRDPTPWRQLGASLFSLQILTTTFPSFETSWSLSCEMLYYVAWPVVLLFWKGNNSRAVTTCVVASLGSCVAILVLWKYFHRLEHSAFVDGVWTVAVLFPVWACGAWLSGHWHLIQQRTTRRVWLSAIVLCAVAEVLLAVLKFKQYPGWAMHLAAWSSIPGLMFFLAGARHMHLSSRPWARPVCRWLGQISYPCYILHMQLLLILGHFLRPLLPAGMGLHPFWRLLLVLIPLLTLVALIGPALERFFMRWRARVIGKPIRPALAAEPAAPVQA